MFGKRKCSKCSKNVEKKFEFCPYCASPLKDPSDYGLLGKSDDMDELDKRFSNSFAGSLGSSLFEKMLGNAMKMLQEQVKQIDQQEEKIKRNHNMKSNFQLFINGRPIPLPGNLAGLKIEKMPAKSSEANFEMEDENGKKIKTSKIPVVSEETFKKSAKLPRKEPKSKLTRLKDRIVYELEIPGLNSLDKVLINKLENSIEIKAFTDKAVYIKALPAKLPLIQYSINNGKLFLEFKAG